MHIKSFLRKITSNIFSILDERNWDLEEGKNVFVVGKITENIQFWRDELGASDFVLSVLEHGYFLPFTEHPPPATERNNKSSLRNGKFVEDSIEQLLLSGCIREVYEKPYCTNPLTVAEGKKLRLVLDLRNVNKYLNVTKFKYEGIQTVRDILHKNDFFVTFDLKNGYHHVPVAKEHQKYLGFAWEFPQKHDFCRRAHFVVVQSRHLQALQVPGPLETSPQRLM